MDTLLATPPAAPAAAPGEPAKAGAFRRLVAVATVLTLALIMLGAWVRLTDAGLGCPDWPGCYGKLSPVHASDQIAQAVAEQGGEHGPVSMGKAWREMLHRYLATGLGLLIVAIAVLAWRRRELLRQSPLLAVSLVGVVVLQGLFGKWTVTLLLKPAIVTGHLLGGMLTFSLLLWLWLRQLPPRRYVDAEPIASSTATAPRRCARWIAVSAVSGRIAPSPVLPSSRTKWKPSAKLTAGHQLPWQVGRSVHASAA